MEYTDGYLQGHFLIAAPGIADERFEGALLYVYRHDITGAAALVINKPSEHIDFCELCEQLSITPHNDSMTTTLFEGGPVEGNRGYVLHTDEFIGRDTQKIDGTNLSLTTTVDIIKRIATGNAPEKYLIALGCALWEAGQLDAEMTRHGWLYAKADMDILFDMPYAQKWNKALAGLGLNMSGLAQYTGRA